MIIMCFGFIYASCLVFGSNDSSFKNVGNAAQIVFFSTMSQFDKSTYEQANISKFISATFYVIFMILFTFVLMKMLITIVILRYRTIRSCKNIEVEARAKLIGEESKKYRQKWYNFVLCKKPKRQQNENIVANANDGGIPNQRAIKSNILEVFKHNWAELRAGEPLKSKDEFEQDMEKARDDILKSKMKMTKDFQERYSYKNIQNNKDNFIRMLLYLIYILLFLTVILMQLQLGTCFDVKSSENQQIMIGFKFESNKFTSGTGTGDDTFTLYDIKRTNEVLEWINQMFIKPNNSTNSSKNIYSFGSPIIRISVTKLKEFQNNDITNNKVIDYYTISDYNEFDYNFSDDSQNTTEYNNYNYYPNGDKNTPNFRGGFIFNFYNNQTQMNEEFQKFKTFILESRTWAFIFVERLAYSRNTEMVVKFNVLFMRLPSGKIKASTEANIFRLLYFHPIDQFRGALELLFVIFASLYFTRTMRRWYFKGKAYMINVYQQQNARLKANSYFMRYFELDFITIRNYTITSFLLVVIWAIIVTFIKTIYRVIYTFLQHLFSGAFEFFDTLSMSLIIYEFVTWIQMIIYSKYEINEDGSDGDTRMMLNYSAEIFGNYKKTCSLNMMLMFLALMQYFTFSSKLSMFYVVIKSALYDIIFFTIMFIVLNMGYSIMGYCIFGISNTAFSSLGNSAFTNILMIIGDFPTLNLQTLNTGLLLTFGISFMLLNLVLLNMFIAIIGTHYFEFYIDMGDIEEINIFKIIIKILLDRFFKEENTYAKLVDAKPVENVNKFSIDKRMATEFNLNESDDKIPVEQKQKKMSKIKELIYKFFKYLIDYANGKIQEIEENDYDDSFDGVSHLEVDDINEFKLGEEMKRIVFGQESDFESVEQDEFYEFDKAYSRSDRNQINFWISALDCVLSKKIGPNYFTNLNCSSNAFGKKFHTNAVRERLGIVKVEEDKSHDENEILFLMETQDKRKDRWIHIPDKHKIRFWRVMLNNYFNAELSEKSVHHETKIEMRKSIKIKQNNFFEEESWNSSESPVHNEDRSLRNFNRSEIECSKNESSVSQSFQNRRFHLEESSSVESETSRENNKLIDFPQLIDIKPHQIELWEHSLLNSPDSIFELWFVGFTHFERVSLWNCLFLYKDRQSQISKDGADMIKTLRKFYYDVKIKINKFKKTLKKMKSKRDQFNYLYKKLNPQQDQRLLLWIPLTLEEKIKLYLTQKDITEQNFIAILLLNCDEGKDITTIFDKYLNSIIKTKYLTVAEIKSTMFIIESLKKCIRDSKIEDFDGYKFICFLVSKLELMKRVISTNYHDLDYRVNIIHTEISKI